MPTVQSCHRMRDVSTANTDEVGKATYTMKYIIVTDGEMAPAAAVNEALLLGGGNHPIPSFWSTFSYAGYTDQYSFARGYQVERDPNSVSIYYCTVTWRPLEPGEGETDSNDEPIKSEPNPVDRPPVFWWDREVFTERVEKDKEDTVVTNYAKGLYPADIELERSRPVLVLEFNVATLGDVYNYIQDYDQAVNETDWTLHGATVPLRTALVREISSGPPRTENGYRFYTISMRIAMARPDRSWDVPKSELGRFHWTKTLGDYDLDEFGNRERTYHDDYVPLNEDGTLRDDTLDYLVKGWRVRPEADFNLLPQ